MTSKTPTRRSARTEEAAGEGVTLKRFYFPTIGNGESILAASQEEANEKAAALVAAKAEVPAKDSSTNE